MTGNVYVRPATENNRQLVATNQIGSQDQAVHYPVYDTFETQLARGNVAGASPFGAYGERTASAGETNRVLWPNGAFSLPDAAGVQMTIVSTDAADDKTGANARAVEIHYLDANLEQQIEQLDLDGLTPVVTVATDIRFINCMHIHEVGANPYAAGTITAKNGGVTYAQVDPNQTRCTSSARMIPAGKKCFVAGAIGGAASGTAAAAVVMKIVASELDVNQYVDPLIFYPYGGIGIQDTSATYRFPVPIVFSAGTVIALTVTTDKIAVITGSWFGWLEDA